MISEKALRTAAKELQDVMGLDPAINLKAKVADLLAEVTNDAIPQIQEGDSFSEATQAVIDEIKGGEPEEEEAPVKKVVAKKKPAPVEEEVEEEPEPEEAVEEDDDLATQIADAQKVSDLAIIVKANSEFKSLKAKLATFTKASVLKAAMLELLPEPEEEPEPEPVKKMAGKVANAAIKKPAVEEEEEEETPTKKPAGKGKTPFVSTKETLGTTRGIEVFKAMQSIKGSQTIDAIAAIADAKFVKAGGASNLKQSKNIVKVFTQAAIEWGIVVDKADKLSNP
jgi:hypothetical protein